MWWSRPASGRVDVALGHRRAAELAAPDHERVVEHAALLEVGDQGGAGLVGRLAQLAHVLVDAVVEVPVAVVELNEPHAALGQPAGQQAVVGERAVGAGHAVHVEHVLRLVEMSTSSGTLVCMRNASSYWAMRVAISGFVLDGVAEAVELVDRRRRRRAAARRSTPGGLPT